MQSTHRITIHLLAFGAAREAIGFAETETALTAPCTAAEAREQLFEKYPALKRFGNSLLFAVNQEYARPDLAVTDGDEVAVFPPVSGGAQAVSADVAKKIGRASCRERV